MTSTYGGKVSSKMKKYPRILEYLQAHHSNIYDILDSLAMHGSLTPRRGGGITFLLPSASLVKSIQKDLESSDPEKAADSMSSLIIVDHLPTLKDWEAKKDDIPNLLGKVIQVDKVDAKTVHLVGGGKLTLDTRFVPFSRLGKSKRGNMAVWKLDGALPPCGDKVPVAKYKYLQQKKKGGRVRGGDASARMSYAAELESKYVDYIKKKHIGVKTENPYVECLGALVEYATANDAKFAARNSGVSLLEVLRVVITPCAESSFYNLMEPYRSSTDDSIIDATTFEEFRVTAVANKPVDSLCDFFNNVPKSETGAYIYRSSGMRVIEAEKDKVRERIARSGLNRVRTPGQILDAELDLAKNNRIGSISPVNPEDAHRHVFGSEPYRKPFFDEASYVRGRQFMRFCDDPATTESDIRELFSSIRLECPGNDYENELRLINKEYWTKRKVIDHQEFYCGPIAVMESSYFLNTLKSLGIVRGRGEYDEGNPHQRKVVNNDAADLARLRSGLNAPLRLGAGELAKLQAIIDANGGNLPEGIKLGGKPKKSKGKSKK